MKFPKTYGLNNVPMSMNGLYDYPNQVVDVPLGKNKKITMQGIDYPVLGVSDTGDAKVMQPNQQNISFDGSMVREFPLTQYGQSSLVEQDATKVKPAPIDNTNFQFPVVDQYKETDLMQTSPISQFSKIMQDFEKIGTIRSDASKMQKNYEAEQKKLNQSKFNWLKRTGPILYSYIYDKVTDSYGNKISDFKRQNLTRAMVMQMFHEAHSKGKLTKKAKELNNFGGRKFVGKGTENVDYVISSTQEQFDKNQYNSAVNQSYGNVDKIVNPLTEDELKEWPVDSVITFDTNSRFTKYKTFKDGVVGHIDAILNSNYYGQFVKEAYIDKQIPDSPAKIGYALQKGKTLLNPLPTYASDRGYEKKLENLYKTWEPIFDFYEKSWNKRKAIGEKKELEKEILDKYNK